MNLNYSAIAKVTGIFCVIFGIAMMPSLFVALFSGESKCALAFVITAAFTILSGSILYFKNRHPSGSLRIRDGFLLVSLIWLLAALLGALPFVISSSVPDFIDAAFEACSGFTTTGSSIITDFESFPASMMLWRSVTSWIGGLAIIVAAMRFNDKIKTAAVIYSALTLLEILLLLAGGIGLFDSIINSLGTVSTGGFSNYQDGAAHFDSTYVSITMTVFMLISGVSMSLYCTSVRKGPGIFVRDTEFKTFIAGTAAVICLIALDLFSGGIYSGGEALKQAAFQTASTVSTSGFYIADYTLWPSFSQMLLFLIFFIGACSCSAGGGLKVFRILVVLKYIRRGVHARLHPKQISDVKIQKRHMHSQEVTDVVMHFFLFSAVLVFGTILVSFDNNDLITGFSAVLSSIANIGHGFNAIGPGADFNIFSGFSKVVLSIVMIAGRIELASFFIIFTPRFWNPDR